MITYTTIGTNDFEKAVEFYDALLAEMGGAQVMKDERMVIYAGKDGAAGPMIAVCKPYDEKPASVGNGMMVALNAGSKEVVDKLHKKALSLGSKDEGEPGKRGDAFYLAYFRDLDGNKLAAFCPAG